MDEPANGRAGAAEAALSGEKAALRDALRLVARAEQCVAGLSLKLQKKGYDRAVVKVVTASLAESGMLDDARYARLWLGSRVKHRPDTPRELISALRAKGISRYTAARALKEVLSASGENLELALLRRFTAKKGLGGLTEARLREKLRFEGFSSEVLDCLFDE
ncbi:MAG: recombination regulator RecX [Spirochaetaceae bacterium]|nr:recombination regulator RecX [Spirochaetaceae bacterium]